jgi:hypothetical protein
MFYKILENGTADVLAANTTGYIEFEFGNEPEELEVALLLGLSNATKVVEAREYLISTDWTSLRGSEGGTPMSQEIKQLRADARVVINNLVG